MAPRWLDFSDRLYGWLLKVYPGAFRERFAAEMVQVFHSLCLEANDRSGGGGVGRLWLSALWDGMWGAAQQWWLRLFRQRMGNMQSSPIDGQDGIKPLSPLHAAIAALPFLAFGASSLLSKLGIYHTGLLVVEPYQVFNWLVLAGLVTCLLAGFPRWGYAYLGWGILFAWWWEGMSFYGYTLGWKIWLPLLGALLIPAAVRRSWEPLRLLLSGLWKDWTLLSLGIYILYASVYMIFDENHHPYLLAFITATTLVTSAGAWGYFRATTPLRRVLVLMGGLFLAGVLSGVSYATWDYRAYYGLSESAQKVNLAGLIAAAILVLLMLGNGLLARWRLKRGRHLKTM